MKKQLLVLSLTMLMFGAFAQHKTAAEKKKEAQLEKENHRVFGKNDTDFDVTELPEKWSSESAVILCQKFDYSYLRQGANSIMFKETLRKRILINDNKAKEGLSIFYYQDILLSKDYIGFRVIKPSGKIVEVDISEAVEVSGNEVPSIYRANYYYYKGYKKIAIPNLEVGDIIDYYYTTREVYSLSVDVDGIHSYSPFIFTLSKSYPILKQKFFYNVDVGFKVSYRTYNGAPQLIEGDAGVNRFGKKKDHIKTFHLVDYDREKSIPEYWKYSYLNEPTIKFQVNYVPRARVDKTPLLVSSERLINKSFDLKEFQKRIPLQTSKYNKALEVVGYIKKYHKTEKNPEKIADLAYYYLRYVYYKELFFGYYNNYKSEYRNGEDVSLKSTFFVNTMIEILKRFKITPKYVIAADRRYGNLNDVLIKQELHSGLKVGNKYYFYMSNMATSNNLPTFLQGSEVIEFKVAFKYDKIPYTKTIIKPSPYSDNSITSEISVNLNEDLDKVTIEKEKTYQGECKDYFTGLALRNTDYFENDKKHFDPKYQASQNHGPKTKRVSKNMQFKLDEEKRKKEALDKEKIEKKYKALIDYYKDDYEISKFNKFKVIDDGRFADSKGLIVEENFDIEDVINKAGHNYIFNIGELVGSQLALDEDDMTRESDINIDFAKEFTYNIEINIPEGYTVEGIEDLNISVDNDNGSFISSAKLEGNKLIVKSEKKYKKVNAPKEEWSNYIAFLEKAYDFSQKKVIIKKK